MADLDEKVARPRVYLISCSEQASGSTHAGVVSLQCQWWHHLHSTWVVVIKDLSPSEVSEAIRKHMLVGMHLLVIELPRNVSRQGWLPKEAWEWLDQNVDDPKPG